MDAFPPITVAVTRFEDLLALGIRTALAADPSVSLVTSDIEAGRIGVLVRAHRPRVLIVDVAALRDLAQVRELALEHPATCIVVLGRGLSSADTAQLLAFGASACLDKTTQARDLLHAVHLASRGMQLQPMPTEPGAVRETVLTPREGDVLFLLRQDRSNAQIAATLHIGIETVRSHARNIYRKLGVTSRRGLLALPAAAAPSPPAPVTARR